MAIPNNLSPAIRKLLWGTPWGEVFPKKPNPPPLATDGRSVALGTLKRYLSEITFRRSGGRDDRGTALPPVDFKVASKDIQIGWPDDEKKLEFPSLVFLHGSGDYEPIGLTAYIEEKTLDVYGPGTVVQWMSEYTETFQIEIWANKRAELRALIAGIETSLSPTELMYGLRFVMPDYYGQLVRFTPMKRQEFDEADSGKGRRRARIDVEMAFNLVALVNYKAAQWTLRVDTDVNLDTNTALTGGDCNPPKTVP